MPYGKRSVGRGVPCAEARTAEGGLDDGPRFHEPGIGSVFDKRQRLRLGCRIDVERKRPALRAGMGCQDVRRDREVFVRAAGAARNDALIDPDAAAAYLAAQIKAFCQASELFCGFFFHMSQVIGGMCDDFSHGEGVAGMKRQGDHGLHARQVYAHKGGKGSRRIVPQRTVGIGTAMCGKVCLHLGVRFPDGGKAGGLGGHDVNAAAVVNG